MEQLATTMSAQGLEPVSKAQKDRKKNARKTQVHTPKPLKKEKHVCRTDWFEQQVAELERHGDRR